MRGHRQKPAGLRRLGGTLIGIGVTKVVETDTALILVGAVDVVNTSTAILEWQPPIARTDSARTVALAQTDISLDATSVLWICPGGGQPHILRAQAW